ncbi:MAG: ribonuclease P protein component [Actinobacteria bacterium]|nr:ribonuclease P protein component [Thermoleophilia bacterium]MCX6410231.1 ribonuclease P protein component [Actinomycetota bacterium]
MPDGARAPREKRSRVTRSGDFDAVYRRGRSASGRHLVVYAFDRGEGDSARLGLSVGKRVGNAVERNRVKRVLREEFSRIAGDLPPGVDFVVIARPGAHEYIEERGSRALGERLHELTERVSQATA